MFARTGVLVSEEDICTCLSPNTINNVFVAATQIPRFGLQQPGESGCYGVIVGFSKSADSAVAAGTRATTAVRYKKVTEYILRIYSNSKSRFLQNMQKPILNSTIPIKIIKQWNWERGSRGTSGRAICVTSGDSRYAFSQFTCKVSANGFEYFQQLSVK